MAAAATVGNRQSPHAHAHEPPDLSCSKQSPEDRAYVAHWLRANADHTDLVAEVAEKVLQEEGHGEPTGHPSGENLNPHRLTLIEISGEAESKYNDLLVGRIARSKMFEFATVGMIFLNAGVIAWDTEYTARFGKPDNLYDTNGDGDLIAFAVLENAFALYFTTEILIRFVAYRHKKDCLRDGWFIFDSVLVSLMVLDTWIIPFAGSGTVLGAGSSYSGILRLLRLLRITRMAKLMRAFPQLMMIVKGITAATKAVFWTFLLLLIITYFTAILFTTQYHQGLLTDEDILDLPDDDNRKGTLEFFGSMGKSMLSLLVMGTILDDVTACTDAIRASGSMVYLTIFILYILINSFTMMNMLVSMIVEVMHNTADGEQQRAVEEGVRESMMSILMSIDQDKSGTITRREFEKMRNEEKVMKELKNLGIKEKHFDQYIQLLFEEEQDDDEDCLQAEVLDPEEKKIGFKALLDGLCRLRPGQSVKALDFASFRHKITRSQDRIRDQVSQVERLTAALSTAGGLPDLRLDPGRNGLRGQDPPMKINAGMFEELERTSSADIINELHRRLGLSSLEETGVPLSMMDEELQNRVRKAEAFQTLGGSEEVEWSKGTLTC